MGKMLDIFNYWKDKCITEDGEVLIEYGYTGCDYDLLDQVESIPVVEDWGEPSCFACGLPATSLLERDDYEKILEDDNWEKKIWNSKEVSNKFDRAHIIPKALNGKDKPSNIFCLCHICHRDSPDTRFKKEFFRWVFNERKLPRRTRLAHQAINICEQRNIIPLFDFDKDLNIHNNIGSHGGKVADSSIVASLVGSAEERNSIIKNISTLVTTTEGKNRVIEMINN